MPAALLRKPRRHRGELRLARPQLRHVDEHLVDRHGISGQDGLGIEHVDRVLHLPDLCQDLHHLFLRRPEIVRGSQRLHIFRVRNHKSTGEGLRPLQLRLLVHQLLEQLVCLCGCVFHILLLIHKCYCLSVLPRHSFQIPRLGSAWIHVDDLFHIQTKSTRNAGKSHLPQSR